MIARHTLAALLSIALALSSTRCPAQTDSVTIAYERLIRDAIKGDSTLFVRRDELEQAWAWIDQIQAARKAARAPLLHYPAGCHGPDFE
jgi:glucose-6-phosphate 1-dehydrogenase